MTYVTTARLPTRSPRIASYNPRVRLEPSSATFIGASGTRVVAKSCFAESLQTYPTTWRSTMFPFDRGAPRDKFAGSTTNPFARRESNASSVADHRAREWEQVRIVPIE
jgi:hypothetical protein